LTRALSTSSSKAKVLVLAGPTASGKTELLAKAFGAGAPVFFSGPRFQDRQKSDGQTPASISGAPRSVDIACGAGGARYAGGPGVPGFTGAEVISADSFQAYRGMNIGTAKPDSALCRALPHHLIDFLDPDQQYTAGDFVRMADNLCAELALRNCLPVVAGGTGFYLRNFICGPASAPPSDPATRRQVAADLEDKGADSLRRELALADPGSAARIAPNDTYRLTRAVEILRTTGKAPSCFAPSRLPRDRYEFLVLGLGRPRAELNARIGERVDDMFARGLAGEAAGLVARGYGIHSPGMKAIGYSEFLEMPGAGEEAVKTAVTLHTRQYAKRQMTFFRALPGIVWISPSLPEFLNQVEKFLRA